MDAKDQTQQQNKGQVSYAQVKAQAQARDKATDKDKAIDKAKTKTKVKTKVKTKAKAKAKDNVQDTAKIQAKGNKGKNKNHACETPKEDTVSSKGCLLIVGTPIGNLSDISVRAKQALEAADTIYCEDTRVTKKLLGALDIHTKTERADEHVLATKIPAILAACAKGKTIAFVSDAGMPAISDPGQRLVDAAYKAGIAPQIIPGPSAAVSALVASGFPGAPFFFEGFLPRKTSQKCARLEELAALQTTCVIFESPHRVPKTLAAIAEVMPKRSVALVRELTKLHEEVCRGAASQLAEEFKHKEVRGECVIVIAAPVAPEQKTTTFSPEEIVAYAQKLLAAGGSPSLLAKDLAKNAGISRNEAYVLLLKEKEKIAK